MSTPDPRTPNPGTPSSWSRALAAGPSATTVGFIGDEQVVAPARPAARRLGIGLAVFDPARGGDLGALFEFAAGCEAVDVDPAVVGPDRLPWANLDRLRDAGHRVWPHAVVVRLCQDDALARRSLGAAGFPVASGEDLSAGAAATTLSAVVSRRPSGWWRARVVAAEGGPPLRAGVVARARDLGASVADGLGATGSLSVELRLTSAGDLVVARLGAGPRGPGSLGPAAMDDHLRALLDRPLTAGPNAGAAVHETAALL